MLPLAAVPPVPLVRLLPHKLAYCQKSPLIRPACPTRVPRLRGAFLVHLAEEGLGTKTALVTFNMERGGEYPAQPERNRPPRMAHLVIVGGSVERSAAGVFDLAHAPRVRLRNGLMRQPRDRSLSFGRVRWSGLTGDLFLAPSYPRGGMLGNHLVFRWRTGERRYVVSLHAWEPLVEAAATLRAVVASRTGRVRRRASAVRRTRAARPALRPNRRLPGSSP